MAWADRHGLALRERKDWATLQACGFKGLLACCLRRAHEHLVLPHYHGLPPLVLDAYATVSLRVAFSDGGGGHGNFALCTPSLTFLPFSPLPLHLPFVRYGFVFPMKNLYTLHSLHHRVDAVGLDNSPSLRFCFSVACRAFMAPLFTHTHLHSSPLGFFGRGWDVRAHAKHSSQTVIARRCCRRHHIPWLHHIAVLTFPSSSS